MNPHRVAEQLHEPSVAAITAAGGLVAFLTSLIGLQAGVFLWAAIAAALAHHTSGAFRAFLDPADAPSAVTAVRGFAKKLLLGLIVPLGAIGDAVLEEVGVDAAQFGWIPQHLVDLVENPLAAAALMVLTLVWSMDTLRNIREAGAMPKLIEHLIRARMGSINLDALSTEDKRQLAAFLVKSQEEEEEIESGRQRRRGEQ